MSLLSERNLFDRRSLVLGTVSGLVNNCHNIINTAAREFATRFHDVATVKVVTAVDSGHAGARSRAGASDPHL